MLSIAKLKSIKDLQQENFYCPLLDANNSDNCGQYTYVWQNSIYQGNKTKKLRWIIYFFRFSSISYINNDAEYTI
jgi:hypothetical protein